MKLQMLFRGWNWSMNHVQSFKMAEQIAKDTLTPQLNTSIDVYGNEYNGVYFGRFECDSKGVIVWIPKKED